MNKQLITKELSEILAAVIVERPDILAKVSGTVAAGTMPVATKSKRVTAKERKVLVMRMFNRQHEKENIRQQSKAS